MNAITSILLNTLECYIEVSSKLRHDPKSFEFLMSKEVHKNSLIYWHKRKLISIKERDS